MATAYLSKDFGGTLSLILVLSSEEQNLFALQAPEALLFTDKHRLTNTTHPCHKPRVRVSKSN